MLTRRWDSWLGGTATLEPWAAVCHAGEMAQTAHIAVDAHPTYLTRFVAYAPATLLRGRPVGIARSLAGPSRLDKST